MAQTPTTQGAVPPLPPPPRTPIAPSVPTAQPVPVPKPQDPTMGTTEETFPQSGEFYYAFGGEPLPDWPNLANPTDRILNDLCFRPVDPVSGQKSSIYRTRGLTQKNSKTDKLVQFQKNVWKHLTKHGLDTISYLTNPNDPSNCLSVVTHHARFMSDLNNATT